MLGLILAPYEKSKSSDLYMVKAHFLSHKKV